MEKAVFRPEDFVSVFSSVVSSEVRPEVRGIILFTRAVVLTKAQAHVYNQDLRSLHFSFDEFLRSRITHNLGCKAISSFLVSNR